MGGLQLDQDGGLGHGQRCDEEGLIGYKVKALGLGKVVLGYDLRPKYMIHLARSNISSGGGYEAKLRPVLVFSAHHVTMFKLIAEDKDVNFQLV